MDYSELESKLGCTFKNKLLLQEALTHRSYLNENRDHPVPHYERLEFLGDAVLELVVTEFIFERFPRKTEGELTAMRSYLVNIDRNFEGAQSLGLERFVLLSRGESKDLKSRKAILGDVFEAILGALYRDQGFKKVQSVIEKIVLTEKNLDHKNTLSCAKSKLQEQLQGKVGITPVYRLIQETGPDHDKKFVMATYAGSTLIGQGEGSSKAQAEERAAEIALKKIS